MRNVVLQGYLIHRRAYREKSHIVYLFTQEYGRIDGILRQTVPPQYQLLHLQASGKGELKSFSRLERLEQPVFFQGDAFFAGFYLNELLLKLTALEEPMPLSFLQYQYSLQALAALPHQPEPSIFLRQTLRRFEHVLLQELGYAVDFSVDAAKQAIQSEQYYYFDTDEGFRLSQTRSRASFKGEMIISMQSYRSGDFSLAQLNLLAKLYRQIIGALLGDRPLKSRQLWVQHKPNQA